MCQGNASNLTMANQEGFLFAHVDANGQLHHILIENKNSEKDGFVLHQQQLFFL